MDYKIKTKEIKINNEQQQQHTNVAPFNNYNFMFLTAYSFYSNFKFSLNI